MERVGLYTKKVIEHFKKPHNMGRMKKYDGLGKVGNIICGDVLWLYIKIGKDKKGREIIKDVKFETYGCVAALATSSVITDLVKGRLLEEALEFNREEIVKELGGLPAPKLHCSVLAADGLYEAIYNYFKKQEREIPEKLIKAHQRIERDKKEIEKRYKEWVKIEEEMYKNNYVKSILLHSNRLSEFLLVPKMKKQQKIKKVIVAMSGGIDSSVAAALLRRVGFDVIGVFMKFWMAPEKDGLVGAWNRCCSPEAEARARKVAKILKIPFYVFNFEKEFKKRIVDYFLDGYKKGITPNPCVVCNKEIKFGLLLEKALALEADFVATGHYVKKYVIRNLQLNNSSITHYGLRIAKDRTKDQSYFLWQLSQNQLKHILFPLGNYTKAQVRDLAKKFKLPVLDIPESMEICFIRTTLNDFLVHYLKSKPGPILTTEGKRIGQHRGLPFYTIGQRKGIELSGGPFYVVAKDLKKDALIVTPFFNDKNLYRKSLIAKNVNWVSGREPKLPLKIKAQIRYGHKTVSATLTKKLKGRKIELIFAKPQRAITPGQSVVFYQGQELLGGGIIC